MMTWFIFLGDMLVMLFMIAIVVWVLYKSPDSASRASRIPLEDEERPS